MGYCELLGDRDAQSMQTTFSSHDTTAGYTWHETLETGEVRTQMQQSFWLTQASDTKMCKSFWQLAKAAKLGSPAVTQSSSLVARPSGKQGLACNDCINGHFPHIDGRCQELYFGPLFPRILPKGACALQKA